jgi:predicted amidohydrolase YtcJ
LKNKKHTATTPRRDVLPWRRCAVAVFLLVGCTRAPSNPADILIVNAKAFTADSAATIAEAVAITGNRITRIGTRAEVEALKGDSTRVIDAHGATVTPGMNDAHVHFLQGSLALDEVDLLDAEQYGQVQQKIRAFAAAHHDRAWVRGHGWLYGAFPGGMPNRQQLDSLVPDRPAVMECYDFHTRWVNSKALELAGITRHTPDPPNGTIVRDPETGEPTGALKEAAASLIDKVLPKPTAAEKLQALRLGFAEAQRYGITSVTDASTFLDELGLFDSLNRAGQLGVRMYIALQVDSGFTEKDADRFDSLRTAHGDTPMLRMGAVKLYADGVIEAHTAWMLENYANKASRGRPDHTPASLNRIVAMMDRRGWQILIHAIGDAGIRMSLDALARADSANPAHARGRRNRIEHIEAVSAADIPRFGRLGVIASMQPFHANPNDNIFSVWAANIGPERASRAWNWKSILDGGARLAFGTDWPVVGIDPRPGMHVALTRQTPAGKPENGFVPSQRLPLRTVLQTFTAGNAWAEFDDQRKGVLKPGMLADLAVWSTDLFALPVDKVKDARVELTILDGKVVYEGKK